MQLLSLFIPLGRAYFGQPRRIDSTIVILCSFDLSSGGFGYYMIDLMSPSAVPNTSRCLDHRYLQIDVSIGLRLESDWVRRKELLLSVPPTLGHRQPPPQTNTRSQF